MDKGAHIPKLVLEQVRFSPSYIAVTSDSSPLSSVHGEYRVSPLEMVPPEKADGRLSGAEIHRYVDTFVTRFLEGRIEYGIEVQNICRNPSGRNWTIEVQNVHTGDRETREYGRVVLCTGVSAARGSDLSQ